MIVNTIAAIGVIGGALLMALGSIGLLRFPDVLTRMHAATKAATVGVIATTAAAALASSEAGGIFALVLVVAFLFLSSPLGMSLLARAAYHDPATALAPGTRDLPFALQRGESTAMQRASRASPFLGIWLLAVWIAAFGAAAPNVVVGGILVAGALALVLRRMTPRWPGALLRPLEALRFVGFFVVQLVRSTLDVVWSLRLSDDELRPAIVEVPIRAQTRNEVALLANTISFTPGTVALELHGEHVYVHVLHLRQPEAVLDDIRMLEERIIAAFGRGRHRSDSSRA